MTNNASITSRSAAAVYKRRIAASKSSQEDGIRRYAETYVAEGRDPAEFYVSIRAETPNAVTSEFAQEVLDDALRAAAPRPGR